MNRRLGVPVRQNKKRPSPPGTPLADRCRIRHPGRRTGRTHRSGTKVPTRTPTTPDPRTPVVPSHRSPEGPRSRDRRRHRRFPPTPFPRSPGFPSPIFWTLTGPLQGPQRVGESCHITPTPPPTKGFPSPNPTTTEHKGPRVGPVFGSSVSSFRSPPWRPRKTSHRGRLSRKGSGRLQRKDLFVKSTENGGDRIQTRRGPRTKGRNRCTIPSTD